MNQVMQDLFNLMNRTVVCAGLDPDVVKLPQAIIAGGGTDEDKTWEFLTGFISAVAPHVCAFKPNKAFFDTYKGGKELLRAVIQRIHKEHPGIPVLLDCKIGDTGNTMEAYKNVLFGQLEADGVMVTPYLGEDAVRPMAEHADKVVVVVVRSSNPSAAVTQDIRLVRGCRYWEFMLDQVIHAWNQNDNLIPVLSSTAEADYTAHRGQIPQQMPVFLAGVGAQGGDPRVLQQLLNRNQSGVLVNSSRDLLYPPHGTDESWQQASERAVRLFHAQLEELRREEVR